MMTLALMVTPLALLVAFHGAAAGIRAAAGRDGRLDHRRAERMGAARGIGVAFALVTPAVIVGAVVTNGERERLDVYQQGGLAVAVVAGPVAATAALAFGVALVASWQVRAFVNTVVIGGLEFVRPAVAAVAVVAVWLATRDVMATALFGFATASALQAHRVTARLWYASPATLPPITTSQEEPHAHR
ncbi:MAG: hypothetical protein CVT64_01640 [Actinobacteria bacterium HGW-Actinobacteria-4]|nr:MAG: hypothetical protein CVT64_01640 [Actinobacteria bacterium HGW-Actinobacteria-4]